MGTLIPFPTSRAATRPPARAPETTPPSGRALLWREAVGEALSLTLHDLTRRVWHSLAGSAARSPRARAA